MADLLAACRAQVGFFGVAANREARTRLEALGACEIFLSPGGLACHLGLSNSKPKDVSELHSR